jgi:uncharacterized protein
MSQPHEFTIPITDLDAGGREYTFPVRAAWIRGALEGCEVTAAGSDGVLDVRASKSGVDVVVHGHLKADLRATCARCLAETTLHVDSPITALLVPASDARAAAGAGDEDLPGEQLDVLTYSGDQVHLDDVVRDELVLEIPMIPLCSEDCPGIPAPSAKGAEDAPGIDPRLAPLLRLKRMTEKKE